MDLGLSGNVAIVTGASRGIGLAVVRALVAEGVRVVAGARSSSAELETLARHNSVDIVPVDLATAVGPAQLVARAGDRVDILVNNVGGSVPRPGGFLDVTDEQWSASIAINLMAAIRTTRAVLPRMLSAGSGSIVNVASVNAWLSDPGIVDYCAAKAGMWSFAKALSKEVSPRGIRVNTVAPGPVDTRRWQDAEVRAAVTSRLLTGRLTRPEEVADVVLMLASNRRSGNTTGSTVTLDGGAVTTL